MSDTDLAPPLEPPTEEGLVPNPASATVGFLTHDVARLMRKRFEQRTAKVGFTRSQWQVLVYLANYQGIHQAGLAEIIEVEPITLTRILDKLEARGLVERRQHPTDRRVWLLYLTPAAHPSISLLRKMGEATRNEALVCVGEDDRKRLLEILTLMKSNLTEACRLPVLDEEANHG